MLRVASDACSGFSETAPPQLLKMLLGQIAPDEGCAVCNPLMHVQLVPEVPAVIEGTIQENLLMGTRTFGLAEGRLPTNEQLWTLCKHVGISNALLGSHFLDSWASLPMTHPCSLTEFPLPDLRKLGLVRALLQRPDALLLQNLAAACSEAEVKQLEATVRAFLDGSLDRLFLSAASQPPSPASRALEPSLDKPSKVGSCRRPSQRPSADPTAGRRDERHSSERSAGGDGDRPSQRPAWRSVLWSATDEVLDGFHKEGDALLTLESPTKAMLEMVGGEEVPGGDAGDAGLRGERAEGDLGGDAISYTRQRFPCDDLGSKLSAGGVLKDGGPRNDGSAAAGGCELVGTRGTGTRISSHRSDGREDDREGAGGRASRTPLEEVARSLERASPSLGRVDSSEDEAEGGNNLWISYSQPVDLVLAVEMASRRQRIS